MISILFSPKPFVGQDAVNQRNALASWRREVPDAELICYGDASGVADACRDFGATLISDLLITETGAPRFDWIVRHAAEHAKYDLQMFINADIFLQPGFATALAKIRFPQFLAISDRATHLLHSEGVRLKRSADSTVRAALVYDGSLAPTVPADGYFDALITFADVAGLR